MRTQAQKQNEVKITIRRPRLNEWGCAEDLGFSLKEFETKQLETLLKGFNNAIKKVKN